MGKRIKKKSTGSCDIDGCHNKVKAKGLCSLHYDRIKRGCVDMRPEKMGCWDTRKRPEHEPCVIDGCDRKYYAKGLCKYHYSNLVKTGNAVRARSFKSKTIVKCIVNGCDRLTSSLSKYGMCALHRHRRLFGMDIEKPIGNKMENNPRWNGGTSYFKNHYELKKNRLLVLNSAEWICAKCGEKATSVIHKDRSRDNHSIENLEARCKDCIDQKHGKKKTSKFIRIYGKTAKDLAIQFGVSEAAVNLWHRKNTLAKRIEK